MDSPLVSIIISTYNRAKTLSNTLASLSYQRYSNFEAIVVNGPSTDETIEVLKKFEEHINVFGCEERNLSKSRNIGIANASGDIVAFIDDDAIPEYDWLEQLVETYRYQMKIGNKNVAAVGGFIRDHTGVSFQAKYVVANLFGQGEGFDTLEQTDCEEAPENPRYFSLTGTNSSFLRGTLLDIGGFDEVFEYFLDETDVNRRLVDAGYKSVICPDAEIHHKYAPSHLRTEKNVPKNMLPTCRSLAYFAVVHALPRYGWDVVKSHLQRLESSELMWKAGNLEAKDINAVEFQKLTTEIRKGIRQGVSLGVNYNDPRLSNKLEDYFVPGTSNPYVSRLRANDRIRLLMLSQDEGSTTPGGIGKWTRLVAEGLGKKGHEITVIGRSEHERPTVDFVEGCYWRHLINDQHIPRHIEELTSGLPSGISRYSGNAYLEYLRVKSRRKFELVSGPIWDVEAAAFTSAKDVPICLSLHTTAAIALDSKPEWQSNKVFYKNHVLKVIAAEKTALKNSAAILGNSDAIVRDIERLYDVRIKDRVTIVPHGVEDIPVALRSSGVRSGRTEVKVLFVGRLEIRKGIPLLVPAIRQLLSVLPYVTVDFVGSGSDKICVDAVQALQADFYPRVQHHGFVDDAALERFYADADLFVAPSRYESFGLIYVEAMRYSLACVATDVGGIPEVVQDGVTGMLSGVDDQEALFRNLLELCSNRELRHNMGGAGRLLYEREFTVETMVDKLEDFYSIVCKHSRGAVQN